MKRVALLGAGFLALGGVATHLTVVGQPPTKHAVAMRPAEDDSDDSTDTPDPPSFHGRVHVPAPPTASGATVSAAEVPSASQELQDGSTNSPPSMANHPEHREALARASAILDERMYEGPADRAESDRMKATIESALKTGAPAGSKFSELECGAKICKVTLTGESDSVLGQSLAFLTERLSVRFPASAVYPNEGGGNLVYLANDSSDIAVMLSAK